MTTHRIALAGALCLMLNLFANSAQAGAALDNELQRFNSYFSAGSYGNISRMVDELSWTGITDQKLFDTIEAKAREKYMAEDAVSIESVSWLLKALALSGNRKYLPLLDEVSASKANKKVRKYANISIERLQTFEAFNPVIAANNSAASTQAQLDATRIGNMLASKQPELLRAGAKRVYNEFANIEALQDKVEAALIEQYNMTDASVHVDAMAWLCKSLAQSGMTKYRDTLRQVADTANNKKIRKYAKKYLDALPAA